MPLKSTRRKHSTKVAITLLSGLLPVMLGFAILYMQAERVLDHSTRHTAEEAIRQFDLMLDNTAQAARELLPLAGQSCLDVNLALREQDTKSFGIRWDFMKNTSLKVQVDSVQLANTSAGFFTNVKPGLAGSHAKILGAAVDFVF